MARLLLLFTLLLTCGITYAQIVPIPDANFKDALVNHDPVIDTNQDGEIQEIEALSTNTMQVIAKNISDMSGIEYFENLQQLNFTANSVSSIDLSNQVILESLSASSNDLSAIDLSNNTNLDFINLSFNDLTAIDLSQNVNVVFLDISLNNLSSIDVSSLTMLENFQIAGNNLSDIDVSNNSQLWEFRVTENPLSSLDVSNNAALQRLYVAATLLTDLDVSQNPLLEYLTLTATPISSIDVSNNPELLVLNLRDSDVSSVDVSLAPDLVVLEISESSISSVNTTNNPLLEYLNVSNSNIGTLDLSNNTNLKVLNMNNLGMDDLDLSNNLDLEMLFMDGNLFTSFDFSNLSMLKAISAFRTPLQQMDVSSNPNLCSVKAGSINTEYINLQNGNNAILIPSAPCSVSFSIPFTISVGSGAVVSTTYSTDLDFICVDDIDFAVDNFTVPAIATLIDDCSIAGQGLNMIQGTVTYDDESDGCDGSDMGLPQLLIQTTDGTNYFASFTSDLGAYNLNVSEATYTTTVVGIPSYFDITPPSAEDTFVGFGQSTVSDFCISPNATVNDLTVSLNALIPARPGFEATYNLVYENVGSTELTTSITLEFDDSRISFATSTPAPSSQSGNTLTWEVGTTVPFSNGTIPITFDVATPPTNQSGDILEFTAMVDPIAGDATPDNNTFSLNQVVVNSFDPNDKLVQQGPQVLIENAADYLNYTVRFQNIGDADAINVRILDELDEKLDFSSIKILEASHNMSTQLVNGRLDFNFENINLPPQTQDEAGSQGYVSFKVKPLPGIVLGDIIANTASIYFDFNAPIITNTVTTEYVDELSVDDLNAISALLYPNPSRNSFTVVSDNVIKELKIYTILRQPMKSVLVEGTNATIDISHLRTGIYFVKAHFEGGAEKIFRVIKE
ncbi:MAG: T9SS type A sorting domain-containing protein [Flavobacteriaceae bacterium]|nr:T9SS type A sorting domain-containing protein [Flavobacteriaceae bacterium]